MTAYEIYRKFYFLSKYEDLLDKELRKFFSNKNRIDSLRTTVESKKNELKKINIHQWGGI